MAIVSEDQIRLTSIEPEKVGSVSLSFTKLVRLAVYDEHYDSLTGRRELMAVALPYSDDTYRDEELVRIARADFHQLCKELAEITKPWALSEDQRRECERSAASDDMTF